MAPVIVAAANLAGLREIDEANPDTSIGGVAEMLTLQDWRKYNYAVNEGYTQEQANVYGDRAIVNDAIIVGTTALCEVGAPLLGAALRPVAWEARAAETAVSTEVSFAGIDAARADFASNALGGTIDVAPNATLRLSTGVPSASMSSSATIGTLVNGLDGVTLQSSRVAAAIDSGDLGVNLLGDTMFEKAYIMKGGAGAAPQAFAYQDQLYLRSGSASLLSDTVHEGTHGLDYLNSFPGSNWMMEAKAYYYERQFQSGAGLPIDFPTNRQMWDHIYQNYKPQ
jgi:hypothetical protein